jgi:hypothetical protein
MGLATGVGIGIQFSRGGGQDWESYWASHAPSDLAVVWENDYAKLTWTVNGDKGSYEIWESLNGGAYSLVATTTEAAITYNNYTWQNASMAFKIRGVGGGIYSDYTSEVTLTTPLVFKTNQSTLNQAKVYVLQTTAGHTVNVNWGDGTDDDYSGVYNNTITHNYPSASNPYFVQISGELNYLLVLNVFQWESLYGSVSKWIYPIRLNNIRFTGTGTNYLTGSIKSILEGTAMQYCLLSGNLFDGDLSSITLKAALLELNLASAVTITDLPRGAYKNIGAFTFSGCSVIRENLLDWLAYVKSNLTTNAPLRNAIYKIDQSRNGVIDPSDAAVTDITAIYVAAGKTCTWYTYFPVVAYSNVESKTIVPLTTYDGSGQNIHPSTVDTGVAGWNGYRYWMANTPYPYGNGLYERPSLWASNDGLNWEIPAGLTNPAIDDVWADTELYFEAGTMYMTVIQNGKLLMSKSTDAVTWSALSTVYDGGTSYFPVSPSMIKIGTDYFIYWVDNKTPTDRRIRRITSATPDGTYGTLEEITLTKPTGIQWWHMGIMEYGGNIYICAGAGSTGIVIAKSADGLTFTRDANADIPIYYTALDSGYQFYRPCFLLVGAQVYVYYSIARTLDSYCQIVRIEVTLL